MPRRSRICYIVLSLGFILFLIGAAPATTSVAEVDDVLQSPKDAVVANVAPVAVDDSYETNEDTPLSIPTPGILANDSDMDGDAFHVEPVEMPSNGVIVLYADGSFVYTPKQDWSGIDSFKYQVADGAGGTSNEATVTITVLPVNDAPVGQDDSYSTDEDGILVVVAADGVLANDGDIEGDPLFISDTLGPTHGILTPLPDGSFTYTPNDDFNGLDSFDYEVSDGVLTDMATVTITVTPVNDAPVAEDDSYTTNEDSPLSIAVPGVLANDSDVDGDSLFVTLFSDPSNGTLTFNGDGSFIYTPDDDFNGLDSFDYEVSDGVLTNTATVTITVLSVNDVPMAMDDTAETNEDVPVEIDVLANDYDVEGDPLVILAIDYGSANGVAELVDLDGSIAVRYTPDPDWNGNTWFAYTLYILDGSWVPQSTGTVYITVYPVNDAPTAVIDYVMTDEDTPIWIDVLANDYDVDGDSVLFGYQITSNADELNGVASISGDGVYYEPNPDWHGTTTSLRYEIRDPSGVTAWGEIHITVASVPDAPVAEDDSYVIEEDAVLLVDAMGGVLANDTDIDGDSLIALVHSMPSSGALILNADGSFSYTPEQNFYGLDSFTYKATDGLLDSTIITVIITVTGVDDEPVAMDDTYVTYVDISLTVPAPGILENDYDVDDEPITEITLTSWPSYGELLEVNADGSFVYIPDTGWSGSVSFSYQVLTSSLSNEATVYITVRVIPVAEDDAYQTDEDTPLIVEQPGVFINDADVDLDIHYAVLVMDALNGTVVLNADGSFSFSPDADFAGIDSFTYFVSDGVEYSNVATVTLTVNPVNDASVAVDDFAVTDEDTPVWIDVLNNDYDVDGDLFELWSIVSGSEIHGMAEIMDDAGLIKILYTPNPNWHGEAWFAYEIYALEGAAWVLQDTGNVYVTVNSVLDAPVAEDDFYTTDEDMPLQIDAAAGVLANDSDGDVDSLTAIIITEPSNGLLVLNDDGSFVYTPNENWFGEDSFAYRVSDGLLTDTGTVTITTNSVDDAPVAVDDFAVTDEDIPVWIDVLNNDYDVDGDIIELWSINDEPGHGVAEIIDDAGWIRILYTPDPDWSGIDSFTYQCYSISISNVATVTITVLDKTPPITTESLDRPPDYNGWYSGDVTVTLSVTDTGPGVVTTKYRYGGIPWTLYTGPFRISAEGRHTLLFNSTDESGNVEGMNTKIILIDKTHPITEMYFETSWGSIIDDYGVRWTQNPVKLYYQYLLSGDSVSGVPIVDDTVWPPLYAVQYKIDDGPWIYLNGAQINPDEYGTPTTDFGVLLETIDTDGIHTVYWYSIDAAGNVERPRQFTFGIDTTPPEVAVTIDGVEGENGWYVTAANILYRATDYVTGLARTDQFDPDSTYFSYSIDSGPVITAALMMGVDFQYSFSTEGKHLFEAWVSDNSDVSGNVNYTAFSIWIDTTTPVNSISLGGTLGDNAWYTSDVMATFTVSDALSGVGWGYFLLYDAQGSWYYSEENTYSAAGSVEVMLTASVESGEIWAWMNTSDVAGNWVIDELVFKIDKTAPTTEASPDRPPYLDDWYISSVTMTLLSYDGFSGVSETLYSINGGSWVVYSVPIDISTEGVNTVSYISTDNAGNVETGSVVVRIDDDVTPPEITLAYTGEGTDGNPGTWIVTVLDAESGVAY
jgi:VCBS repeat-containing protein